jgi:hypothetical protein
LFYEYESTFLFNISDLSLSHLEISSGVKGRSERIIVPPMSLEIAACALLASSLCVCEKTKTDEEEKTQKDFKYPQTAFANVEFNIFDKFNRSFAYFSDNNTSSEPTLEIIPNRTKNSPRSKKIKDETAIRLDLHDMALFGRLIMMVLVESEGLLSFSNEEKREKVDKKLKNEEKKNSVMPLKEKSQIIIPNFLLSLSHVFLKCSFSSSSLIVIFADKRHNSSFVYRLSLSSLNSQFMFIISGENQYLISPNNSSGVELLSGKILIGPKSLFPFSS